MVVMQKYLTVMLSSSWICLLLGLKAHDRISPDPRYRSTSFLERNTYPLTGSI